MPRTIDEIISQAEVLAAGFEIHEPKPTSVRDATALGAVRNAFLARAAAERRVTEVVEKARAEGHSWASIAAMLGTSGEAARQKYGPKRRRPKRTDISSPRRFSDR
jgi:hypothetical protein